MHEKITYNGLESKRMVLIQRYQQNSPQGSNWSVKKLKNGRSTIDQGLVRVKNGQIEKPLAPRDFSPQKPPRYRFSARFLKIEILLIYTGCTQCATPKLPKKVLHIGDIVAHWGHCPEKIEM